MLSESVVLLGKGLYKTIPDEVNINALPTASELEYVGSEDFDSTMIKSILPQVVEGGKDMDFNELLEIDYEWLCRCLRMKSYGPYFTTNRIYCPECNKVHEGNYKVDLRTVGINPLPENFVNNMTISHEEFIDFKDDIVMQILTVRDHMAMAKDSLFQRANGSRNVSLARLCYMIKQIGNKKNLTPIDVRTMITKNMSSADYEILKDVAAQHDNYGLQITGQVSCPVCGSKDAYFIALQQDKFFRPSVGDIREFKSAIRSGNWKKLPGDPSEYVR